MNERMFNDTHTKTNKYPPKKKKKKKNIPKPPSKPPKKTQQQITKKQEQKPHQTNKQQPSPIGCDTKVSKYIYIYGMPLSNQGSRTSVVMLIN